MNTSKCSPITPQQHATMVWALPVSLATTQGIIIIFFSSGYLDVSVPRVGSLLLECHTFSVTGCPIRKSRDISLVCSSPWLIAAYHVLHRLLESRHPPYALNCFKKFTNPSRFLPCLSVPLLLQAASPTLHFRYNETSAPYINLLLLYITILFRSADSSYSLYYYLVYYNFPNMSKNFALLHLPSLPALQLSRKRSG